VNAQVAAEARQVYGGDGEGGSRWEDIFAEGDAYLYWQPKPDGKHTVLFRASATGGWDVATPYQLTLGGRDGVRGYNRKSFPGGRRLLLSLEDRVFVRWPAPEVLDFGLSFFADLGYMEGGGVPFGIDSGWQGAMGVGIRFGLPPGSSRTTRIDLAWPVGGGAGFNDLILRISMDEVLGILGGVRDRQLLRSLRSGIKPYLISTPR
jgi:hypothetical protein